MQTCGQIFRVENVRDVVGNFLKRVPAIEQRNNVLLKFSKRMSLDLDPALRGGKVQNLVTGMIRRLRPDVIVSRYFGPVEYWRRHNLIRVRTTVCECASQPDSSTAPPSRS